jgi:hypothetical protein
MPTGEMFLGPSRKRLPGLHRFLMAGQWVEAGGSVPTSILSGRQAVQELCTELEKSFRVP